MIHSKRSPPPLIARTVQGMVLDVTTLVNRAAVGYRFRFICFSLPFFLCTAVHATLFFYFRFLSFSYYWIIKGITVHLVDCSTLPKVVDKLFDVEVSKFGP